MNCLGSIPIAISSVILALFLAPLANGQEAGIFTAGETPGTHTAAALHTNASSIPGIEEEVESLQKVAEEREGTVSEIEADLAEAKKELEETDGAIAGLKEEEAAETHKQSTNVNFQWFGKEITCQNDQLLNAEASGTDTELTVSPDYTHCYFIEEEPIGLAITATTNGCDWVFNQPSPAEEGHANWKGGLELSCPEEAGSVEFEVYFPAMPTEHTSVVVCRYTLPVQLGVESVAYQNVEGNPDTVGISVVAESISVIQEGLCGGGESSEGKIVHKDLILTSDSHDFWIGTDE